MITNINRSNLVFGIVTVLIFAVSCKSNSQKTSPSNTSNKEQVVKVAPVTTTAEAAKSTAEESGIEKIVKSEEEWKNILSKEAYYVLRQEGTERPFTSDLLEEKRSGTFLCKACGLELFESDSKFKSGTGWPSFYEPSTRAHVHEDTDYKLGYARTEVECGRCGGHLGHVFDDGPKPTGLRYCINGAALTFKQE